MILSLFFFLLPIIQLISDENIKQKLEIVAYYPGNYSDDNYGFEKLIDEKGLAEKLTVINYSFAFPIQDSTDNIIPHLPNAYYAYQKYHSSEMSIDGIADDSSQILRGQFNQLKKLKRKYPQLKILISIGGWGGSKYFSDLSLTHESREKFVDACIDLFILGNLPVVNGAGGKNSALGIFDGIDLDWEFPITGGPEGTHNHPNDRENHTELFKLFRAKLDLINTNLLLTAAVTGRSNEFWLYNFNEDQKYLDWFNLMSYDLHGVADKFTNHHTNLLSSANDIDPKKESLDRMVRYLIDSVNVKPEKIVPGAAYYGKGWNEVDSVNNGLYQKGEFLNSWGYIQFKNYMDFKELNDKGFKVYWDDNTLAPFLYNSKEKIFWSFDDLRSIALKSRYVDAFNLRGLMFWQIFGDDTLGNLTNTIYNKNMPDVTFEKSGDTNIEPTVKIIYPNTQNNFKTGENIIIKTISSDKDGKVVKMEFFVNDNSIGYNIFEPFNWAWFNASKGEHTIHCIAYDNFGKSTISEKVKIFVQTK